VAGAIIEAGIALSGFVYASVMYRHVQFVGFFSSSHAERLISLAQWHQEMVM
jgi:hypothetical protein